jgi:hypothetical protein
MSFGTRLAQKIQNGNDIKVIKPNKVIEVIYDID